MRAPYYILLFLSVSLCACLSKTTAKKTTSIPPKTFVSEQLLTQLQPTKDASYQYETPTLERRLGVEPVLSSVLKKIREGSAEFSNDEVRGFQRGGFQLVQLEHEGDLWVVMAELGKWRGAGAYIFRVGEADPVVFQAPHSYHDINTGEVAFNAFVKTNARALFINTAHRYSKKSKLAKGPNPADLSHRSDTFFFIMTEALAKTEPTTFIQIHGFDEDSAEEFDVVVSDTTPTPSSAVQQFAKAIAADSTLRIGIYGDNTSVYGGTANPVGRWIKRHQQGEFIHVELSPALREAWRTGDSPLVIASRAVLGE